MANNRSGSFDFKEERKRLLETKKPPPEYDDEGYAVVKAYVKGFDALVNPYNYNRINENFGEYIVEETLATRNKKARIRIYSDGRLSESQKEWIKRGIGSYCQMKRERERAAAGAVRLIGSVLLLLALISMTVVLVLGNKYAPDNGYIGTILSVMSWFFLWEGIYRLLFSGNAHRARMLLYLKTQATEISFYTCSGGGLETVTSSLP